ILLWRRAATTFRRSRRVLVILLGSAVPLEHVNNLAEEAFLFLCLFFRLDTIDPRWVPVRSGRRQRFLGISTKHPGKEPLYPPALVAGVARRLVILSSSTSTTPCGWVKGFTSSYWGSVIAFFMNSAHMGAAVCAP